VSGRVEDADVEQAFVSCQRQLGRYLAQIVDDRALAEDLLQDTYVAAARSWVEAKPENPEAWLFGIARHRALAALRRRRRLHGALTRLSLQSRNRMVETDSTLVVRDLLARTLSPEDRSLVVLRYLHDFDANELAAMTGMTPDAVRQRLSRARRKLLDATSPDPGGRP